MVANDSMVRKKEKQILLKVWEPIQRLYSPTDQTDCFHGRCFLIFSADLFARAHRTVVRRVARPVSARASHERRPNRHQRGGREWPEGRLVVRSPAGRRGRFPGESGLLDTRLCVAR